MKRQFHRYTPGQIQYLEKVFPGRYIDDIAMLFNSRFGLSLTPGSIKNAALKRGIKSGYKNKTSWNRIFFEEHIEFIRKHLPGKGYPEIAGLFNRRFGMSVTREQIKNLCGNKGIQSGLTGYFPKGHVPFNKGMKGTCAPGSEKGWFKKGHVPWDYKAVGSERVTLRGFVKVKVSDTAMPVQRRWQMKHVLLWVKANGDLPRGHIVIFLDKNRLNFDSNNLFAVTREEHAIMCHLNLYTTDRESTLANIAVAKIKLKISSLKRKSITNVKNEKAEIVDNAGKHIVVAEIIGKGKYVAARQTKTGLQILRAKKLKARDSIEAAQHDLYEYAMERGWQKI